VFCVDLRTNSDYFPLQHWATDSHQFPFVRLSVTAAPVVLSSAQQYSVLTASYSYLLLVT
jgi:hypothetical protein